MALDVTSLHTQIPCRKKLCAYQQLREQDSWQEPPASELEEPQPQSPWTTNLSGMGLDAANLLRPEERDKLQPHDEQPDGLEELGRQAGGQQAAGRPKPAWP